jgi:uncharacterized protein (DUF1015 family)
VRPVADGAALAVLLCPPYDVIDDAARAALLAGDPDNAVAVVLPQADNGGDPYAAAARTLDEWVSSGRFAVDDDAALYVYEMRDTAGATTRGLVGAVELRDPTDGVILPHEDTMAGPVADRLALMRATEADVEAIYLVYDGGGAASTAVAEVGGQTPLATAATSDGITHTLWAITDPDQLAGIAADLAGRSALIADGHHRYATYRELQHILRAERGPGPWDFGLTLLVDSTTYGPQVHAIHRVVRGLALDDATIALQRSGLTVTDSGVPGTGLDTIAAEPGFTAEITDGERSVVVTDPDAVLRTLASRPDQPATLAELDVTALHRGLVERVWGLADTVDVVAYAHSVDEAIAGAHASGGIAVLLRPTPVEAVAAVAAAGARMPRKSTLFTPKPASGLVMRRFVDADPPAPTKR